MTAPLMPGGESTSAQLRRALGERDEAVRVALDNRAELTRTQQALAASQADLTRACDERDEADTRYLDTIDLLDAARRERDLARAELATARAELERLRPPTTRTGGTPSW